jgi:hypothetical protein
MDMRSIKWCLVLLLAALIINYPNPFDPKGGETMTFSGTTETSTNAYLYIYDMSARFLTRRAFNLTAGLTNTISWDGYTDYNQLAGNGIYLYQVITPQGTRLGKGKIWVINQ